MSGLAWGIVGTGAIAGVFGTSMRLSGAGRVVRVCGRSERGVEDFCIEYGGGFSDDLDDMLSDDAVQAVYIATPHVHHAAAARKVLAAGRAVLCEKPMTVRAASTRALWEKAEQSGGVLVEGWMYRCHPQIARAIEVIQSGELGAIQQIRAWFCFDASAASEGRLFDPTLGGGAILDVGGYPVSAALCFAAAARTVGDTVANAQLAPEIVMTSGELTARGVDKSAQLGLRFDNGVTAEIAVAIDRDTGAEVIVAGELGTLRIATPFVPGGADRHGKRASIEVTPESAIAGGGGVPRVEVLDAAHDCFSLEAAEVARLVHSGERTPRAPMVGRAESIAIAEILESWRTAVGVTPAVDVDVDFT